MPHGESHDIYLGWDTGKGKDGWRAVGDGVAEYYCCTV